MKIVIAPDSFKGSITAVEAARAIEQGISKATKHAEIVKIPMADGGEGTVEAMVAAAGGDVRRLEVTGPLGDKVTAFYGVLGDGKTAVIEMAAASGLPLVPFDKRNPMLATTYGTGELILKAINDGFRKLIIGIGGSATNDGGMGMAQALGFRFFDREGTELGWGGQQLERVYSIDGTGLKIKLDGMEVLVATDVTNTMCGKEGASYVYGPQKGATPEMVKRLDDGMANYAVKVEAFTGRDIGSMPGAGAAGGLGGGLAAFLGADLRPGMQIMEEVLDIEAKIREAALVITGEGRTDYQTAFGKVPAGIGAVAARHNVPVICLSGALGEGADSLYNHGISAMFSISEGPQSLEDAMKNTEVLLARAAENVLRLFLSSKLIERG